MLATRDMNLPLVVTIDQGSKVTIHPPNKAEVGRRAGLAALQGVYKQDVDGTSPLPKSVTYEGGSATVEFDGFKGDLVLKGDAIQGFELAGADGKFQPATAKLPGRRVGVTQILQRDLEVRAAVAGQIGELERRAARRYAIRAAHDVVGERRAALEQ